MAKKTHKASVPRPPRHAGLIGAQAVLQSNLHAALQLHQLGEYAQAESAYLSILKQSSQHFDALQLLGTLYAQTRRFDQAALYLNQALNIQPKNVSVLNNLGYASKELGKFDLAIKCFNKALELKPDYSEAYNNRGNALKDFQKIESALKSYQLSIIYAPQNAEAYYNLSQIHYEANHLEKARTGYEHALLINPNYLEAHTNYALILSRLGFFKESLDASNTALTLKADHPQALCNKGTVLRLMGRIQESIECFKQAHYYSPYLQDALVNLGNAFKDLQNYDSCLEVYTRALIVDPSCLIAWLNRGIVLKEMGHLQSALSDYEKAISIDPLLSEAFFNRGNLYKDLKQFQLAVDDYDQCLRIDSLNASAFNNRGNSFLQLGRRDLGKLDYERAIEIDPSYANAHNNLGVFLHEEMELENALSHLNQAYTLDPSLVDPLWNKALVLLIQGQYRMGFELFEYRWKNPRLGLSPDPQSLGKPVWLGQEDINGSSILLYNEQGLGDTIQFSRYAALVSQLGAKVTIKVQPALAKLFKSSGLTFNIISSTDEFEEAIKNHDFVCPLMSLPLALHHYSEQHSKITLSTPTNHIQRAPNPSESITQLSGIPSPFKFQINDDLSTHWNTRIDRDVNILWRASNQQTDSLSHTQNKAHRAPMKIGLVWSGSSEHWNDHNRSIPFESFIKHLPLQHFYIGLQKEIRASDIPFYSDVLKGASLNLIDFSSELEDFTDTCAILSSLDLVICIDSSVAHLSGSMGKATYLLIPFSPDWRWLTNTSSTPWYPSIKLFRQSIMGVWEPTLEDLGRSLS